MRRFAVIVLLLLTLPSFAHADDVPKDARNAYTRAHQCFYKSGAKDATGCEKTACAYVAIMHKYQDRPAVAQYLRDRYNNVSDRPYETVAASCK